MTHTPAPWFVSLDDEMEVYDTQERYICSTNGYVACVDQNKVNAGHIVKCVNAHDELVAALYLCLSELDCLRDFVGEGCNHMIGATESYVAACKAFDKGHEVLAKAEVA